MLITFFEILCAVFTVFGIYILVHKAADALYAFVAKRSCHCKRDVVSQRKEDEPEDNSSNGTT